MIQTQYIYVCAWWETQQREQLYPYLASFLANLGVGPPAGTNRRLAHFLAVYVGGLRRERVFPAVVRIWARVLTSPTMASHTPKPRAKFRRGPVDEGGCSSPPFKFI